MTYTLYEQEYQFNTSPRRLHNFIEDPVVLQQWYAEQVECYDDYMRLTMYGDQENIRIEHIKPNKVIRYQFLDPNNPSLKTNRYIDFEMEENDMTGYLYLIVREYSDEYDSFEEFDEIWDDLISKLRDIIRA